MSKLKRLRFLSALDLKILAMVLMLCDHLWATVIPGAQWLTDLGRLAFPIFAYQIVEGYFHTHNFKRYLGRLFAFALLSELPFNLMYGGSLLYPFHQNVLFTFCLALLLVRLMDKARSRSLPLFLVTAVFCCSVGYALGFITFVDYFGFGILSVFLFYFCHGLRFGWVGQLAGMIYINGVLMAGLQLNVDLFGLTISFPQQALAVLALIPIWLYNGRQGPHSRAIQLACYAFYPLHILVLAVLGLYVLN